MIRQSNIYIYIIACLYSYIAHAEFLAITIIIIDKSRSFNNDVCY